jgi:hypothetical protein
MNEDLNDCVMCGEDVMHDRAAWLRGQKDADHVFEMR